MANDVADIRKAVRDALPANPLDDKTHDNPGLLYIPPAHMKALRLDSAIIVGGRGVGKTFWTSALSSQATRDAIGRTVRDLDQAVVHIGHAETPNNDSYPDPHTFQKLIEESFTPFDIWKGVVVRWASSVSRQGIPTTDWSKTIRWVQSNPEGAAKILEAASGTLRSENRVGLIVFDALDRTGSNWRIMDDVVRDLLQLILWIRSFRNIFGKVFLREDQQSRTVLDFPDASKLLATKEELLWAPHDLHGLLWQYLCNADGADGTLLRKIYARSTKKDLKKSGTTWQQDPSTKREGDIQRTLFHELTGPWMGRDRRRGVPYVWSVGHLADGRGRTSPRSFLAAIRKAAEETIDRYDDYAYPLHFESIKRGVQAASEIRIGEFAEDYPWVPTLMTPLKGLTVPCGFESIEAKWLEFWPKGPPDRVLRSQRLPPRHLDEGWEGISRDLQDLGILLKKTDGRIDMPDLYRVGFGLGRKGGVKPVKG